ncbi:MAG: redoxin domain-containing protein [Armatimonadetes bacterium]|nr:redoxin domain-containing protein [Armatimonadota bacterium]
MNNNYALLASLAAVLSALLVAANAAEPSSKPTGEEGQDMAKQVAEIFARVSAHEFNPTANGFTQDRGLNKPGVASLEDTDWRVRTLAVRDLVRLGAPASPGLVAALLDQSVHVRYLAAMTLGILRAADAVPALEQALRDDKDPTVRSQAAIALGQIGQVASLPAIRAAQKDGSSADVQYQAELAAYAIEHGLPAAPALAQSYAALDEATFGSVQVGQPARDFQLSDTDGRVWRLADFRGTKPVVLIWVFADWCPVCHGEFRELIELRQQFEAANAQVFTVECHDLFACRVMVGKELEPKHWFSKTSFKEAYTKSIWWPHLVDLAGAVGAAYGVQPMSFAVHSEYINRPSVVIVDKEGIVRFAYYGTFWGDRPSIHHLLEMLRSGDYSFDAPRRLKPAPGPGG